MSVAISVAFSMPATVIAAMMFEMVFMSPPSDTPTPPTKVVLWTVNRIVSLHTAGQQDHTKRQRNHKFSHSSQFYSINLIYGHGTFCYQICE